MAGTLKNHGDDDYFDFDLSAMNRSLKIDIGHEIPEKMRIIISGTFGDRRIGQIVWDFDKDDATFNRAIGIITDIGYPSWERVKQPMVTCVDSWSLSAKHDGISIYEEGVYGDLVGYDLMVESLADLALDTLSGMSPDISSLGSLDLTFIENGRNIELGYNIDTGVAKVCADGDSRSIEIGGELMNKVKDIIESYPIDRPHPGIEGEEDKFYMLLAFHDGFYSIQYGEDAPEWCGTLTEDLASAIRGDRWRTASSSTLTWTRSTRP